MICLDTNILIDILRKNQITLKKLEALEDQEFTTTSINACEIYRGAYASENPSENIEAVESLLKTIKTIGFIPKTYHTYGRLYKACKVTGKFPGELDLVISSIASSHGCILYTRDEKHLTKIPTVNTMVL